MPKLFDPLPSYNFYVVLNQKQIVGCYNIEGIKHEAEPIAFRCSGMTDPVSLRGLSSKQMLRLLHGRVWAKPIFDFMKTRSSFPLNEEIESNASGCMCFDTVRIDHYSRGMVKKQSVTISNATLMGIGLGTLDALSSGFAFEEMLMEYYSPLDLPGQFGV